MSSQDFIERLPFSLPDEFPKQRSLACTCGGCFETAYRRFQPQYTTQTMAKIAEENTSTQRQQAAEAQKQAQLQRQQLLQQQQQQQAEMRHQERMAATQQREEAAANQQRVPTATNQTYSRSQEGIPEHLYELTQDHKIVYADGAIRVRRGERYRGRILVDHAEIDIGRGSYNVPTGILRKVD